MQETEERFVRAAQLMWSGERRLPYRGHHLFETKIWTWQQALIRLSPPRPPPYRPFQWGPCARMGW